MLPSPTSMMRMLVAGSLAGLGASLGESLLFRHHEVTWIERGTERNAAAARAWLRQKHRGCAVHLTPTGKIRAQVESCIASTDAIISIGDPRDPAADLELALALADAVSRAEVPIPIIRIPALLPSDGFDQEWVVMRDRRAALRDFPHGIPEERTRRCFRETDRALCLLCDAKALQIVFLRFAEPVMPGRFEFDPGEILTNLTLQFVRGERGDDSFHTATSVEIVDGEAAAIAIEAAVARIDRLCGSVLHISGGRASTLQIEEALEILQNRDGFAGESAVDDYTSAQPRARSLDDRVSRRFVPELVHTSARHALERFYTFAKRHHATAIQPRVFA
ncbi:MAG: hypothetical protein HY286_14830 [Planctomycetes bacterium]|nr:hypothetical protein [Planctomycetota bacterium]